VCGKETRLTPVKVERLIGRLTESELNARIDRLMRYEILKAGRMDRLREYLKRYMT